MEARDFYLKYDDIIAKICRPYWGFLKRGAEMLPKDVKSVCDLGTGTGNFSMAVAERFPSVSIYGVDTNPFLLERAQEKLPHLSKIVGNAFNGVVPDTDYYVSSLTMHHLAPEIRREEMLKIATRGRGFVNFDLALPKGKTKKEAIDEVINFAKNSFPNSLEAISNEMNTNDHPCNIEEERNMYEREGLEFNLIEVDFPFALYHVFKKS